MYYVTHETATDHIFYLHRLTKLLHGLPPHHGNLPDVLLIVKMILFFFPREIKDKGCHVRRGVLAIKVPPLYSHEPGVGAQEVDGLDGAGGADGLHRGGRGPPVVGELGMDNY